MGQEISKPLLASSRKTRIAIVIPININNVEGKSTNTSNKVQTSILGAVTALQEHKVSNPSMPTNNITTVSNSVNQTGTNNATFWADLSQSNGQLLVTFQLSALESLPTEVLDLILEDQLPPNDRAWNLTYGSEDLEAWNNHDLRINYYLAQALLSLASGKPFTIDGNLSLNINYHSLVVCRASTRALLDEIRFLHIELSINKHCFSNGSSTCRLHWFHQGPDCMLHGMPKFTRFLDLLVADILLPRRNSGQQLVVDVIECGVIEHWEPASQAGFGHIATQHIRDYQIVTTVFSFTVRVRFETMAQSVGAWPNLDERIRMTLQNSMTTIFDHHGWLQLGRWTTTQSQGLRRAKILISNEFECFGVRDLPMDRRFKPDKDTDKHRLSARLISWD